MAFDAEVPAHVTQRDILIRARDQLSVGWCVLSRLDDAGNVCLRGALAKGRGVHPEMTILGEQDDLARALGFEDECAAMCWNDTQTSVDSVLARFDAAIEKLG